MAPAEPAAVAAEAAVVRHEPGLRALGYLASPAAFDLVASSDGAIVAWAAPGLCDGSLHVQRLDADGWPVAGGRREVAACLGAGLGTEAHVVEVAAAAEGGRAGIAWVAQDGQSAALLGTYGADDMAMLAAPQRLGVADRALGSGRGRVSLVASPTSHLRVAFRAPPSRCLGRPGSCAQLLTQPFPPTDSAAGRGGDAREIGTPCQNLLLGGFASAGTWYDAFCARDGATQSDSTQQAFAQVYAIRPEISYAETIETLRGCEPIGLSPGARGVVLWGHCESGLRAHAFVQGSGESVIDGVTRRASCAQGRPLLRAESADGSIELALDEPMSLLQAWLPDALAPAGARAVFTGRRLVVAAVRPQGLLLQRYACRGDELVPED